MACWFATIGRRCIPTRKRTSTRANTFHRRGFIALVKLTPFGQDVIPHEKTYKGPIEDRLKLMRFTQDKLSPIFGLSVIRQRSDGVALQRRRPTGAWTGTLDGVKNDIVGRSSTARSRTKVIDLMKHRANLHRRRAPSLHRPPSSTRHEASRPTAVPCRRRTPRNLLHVRARRHAGSGLADPRDASLIGGLEGFSIDAFRAALGNNAELVEANIPPDRFDRTTRPTDPNPQPHTFGSSTTAGPGKMYMLRLKNHDVLKPLEPNQSDAWRALDVAILQRYLLDDVIGPRFAPGREVTKGYTADAAAVRAAGGWREVPACADAPTGPRCRRWKN
jgi:hypothetical protein